MSSSRFRKPGFRLRLGYPEIILEREGEDVPLARAEPGPEGYAAGLRELAAVAPARAEVTVILPEQAVWRGQVELPRGSRAARRRAASAAAARHLGVPADAIAVTLGEPARNGTPIAAVASSTLADTRALVTAAGLRPAAILGAGDFPGFPQPPRLAGERRPMLTPRHAAAAAIGAGTLAALVAFLAGQPQTTPAQPVPSTPLVVAAAPALAPIATPAPATPPVATPVRQAEARATLKHTAAPPARPAPAPVPPLAVTMATRNVSVITPADGGAPEVRLPPIARVSAPLPRPRPAAATPAAVASDDALRPRPRPVHAGAQASAKQALATPTPDAPISAADGRPLPRPGEAAGVKVASLEPTAGIASLAALAAEAAPPARPASLHTKADATPHAKPKVVTGPTAKKAAPAVARAKPVSAPAKVAKAKPAPAPVAAATPRRVVTVQKAAPKPVVAKAPTRVVNTEPVRVATAAPLRVVPVQKPVTVARVSPSSQYPARPVKMVQTPARSSTPSSPLAVAAATQRVGVQRGGVTLIGIFGTGAGRHALLKMPNGRVQRVTAGDQVAGMQIAAVGADSVQVNSRGRPAVLTLPD